MALTRRELLRNAIATGVVFAIPSWLSAAGVSPSEDWNRHLVLVEFDGGNDGLNTFIPWQDPAYAAKRPHLRVQDADTRAFHDASGVRMNLNLVDGPGNGRFKRLWDDGELAVALGVGMPNPNLSHFRGIDIWNTGSASGTVWTTGWLERSFTSAGAPPGSVAAHGALLARTTSNPLAGSGVSVLAMSNPRDFIVQAQGIADPVIAGTAALQHVLRVQHEVVAARSQYEDLFGWNGSALTTVPAFTGDSGTALFPAGSFGDQCRAVAQMIAAGIGVPVFKISINGFDNHSNQRAKHDDLLAQVAHGLTGLRDALAEKGRLDDVLIMTYSEFGRRVEENGSLGTDHGTLAPHILISGQANFAGASRIHGAQPSLTDLDSRGDLKWIDGTSLDFRRLYATALSFLGMPGDVFDTAYAPLGGLLTT